MAMMLESHKHKELQAYLDKETHPMHNELLTPVYHDVKLLIRKISRSPKAVLLRRLTRDLAVVDASKSLSDSKKSKLKEKLKFSYAELMHLEANKSIDEKLQDI